MNIKAAHAQRPRKTRPMEPFNMDPRVDQREHGPRGRSRRSTIKRSHPKDVEKWWQPV